MRSYNIPTVMEYIRISLLTENLTVYYLHSFLSIVTRESCPKQHNIIFLLINNYSLKHPIYCTSKLPRDVFLETKLLLRIIQLCTLVSFVGWTASHSVFKSSKWHHASDFFKTDFLLSIVPALSQRDRKLAWPRVTLFRGIIVKPVCIGNIAIVR